MSKKNESTNEKIIRLFKEGVSIEDISKETTLGIDIVTGIIEKRIPDFRNYDPSQDNKNGIKTGARSLSRFFGPKKKVNTNMGKDGFVSEQANIIVEMLQKGKTHEEIAEFMSISVEDVKLIEDLKDEHLRRKSLSEESIEELQNEPTSETTNESENTNTLNDDDKIKNEVYNDIKAHIRTNGANVDNNLIIEERPASLTIEKNSTAQTKINKFIQSQIEDDQSRLKELDLKISEKQKIINAIKSDADKISKEITKLKKQIASLEADFEGQNNKYNSETKNAYQLKEERDALLQEIEDYKNILK